MSENMDEEVVIRLGIPRERIDAAMTLYCAAFREKLLPFLGEPDRAARFLAGSLAVDRAFVALKADQVVGLAGFKVDGRGLHEAGFARFVKEYGWSAPARLFGLLLLERLESPDLLLLDGIAVSETMRGKGVGTRLLEALETHARSLGKAGVRLDVVDANPDARRLYERCGFEAQKTRGAGLLRRLVPFRSSTKMIKRIV